jgi:hypothetical protein
MTPAEAATVAAEAVRSLNHATASGTGYAYPSDLYDVVGALATLTMRLPQTIGQAVTWLEREHTAGRVGHDRGSQFTTAEVYSALACLDEALTPLSALSRALNEAHNHTGHLTGTAR